MIIKIIIYIIQYIYIFDQIILENKFIIFILFLNKFFLINLKKII